MTGVSNLADVGVDVIVGDSELVLCRNRQVTGVGDDYTSDEYNTGDHGCRGSRGDKMSELLWTSGMSSPQRVKKGGS